ncbi:sigma-70 family RNA polymerase sigma factor [Metasolibacillus meyeri]|uniref:Sigma-70 family RNA polymerase sigma factor n=1 Tax=Metasolibacillus meyeri TaxID=1071052 RepID=A0AAW9NPK0_9BACL|nr:sigma-70 family RNA polymerase sigma factor [Metasolibacillus meyeri]MEC1177189.1 sigma-70 family RNA polymerase sigma factor [Metasolibacillus meyeri]
MNIETFIKSKLNAISPEKPVNTDWLFSLCRFYELDITKQELEKIILKLGYTAEKKNDLNSKNSLNSTLPKLFTTNRLTNIVTEDDMYSYTRKDNIELLEKYHETKESKYFERLIELNLPLVKSIAVRHLKDTGSLTLDDLIQEGVIGMIKAIEKFDTSLGYSFSTYTTWWVRQRITRAIENQALMIRLPAHRLVQIKSLKKLEQELIDSNNYDLQKILTEFGISIEDYNQLQLEEFQFMYTTSTNLMIGEGEDSELEQFLSIDGTTHDILSPDVYNFSNPSKIVENILLTDYLETAMDCLTDREENILRLRFGLDDGKERTLEQIGDIFGVTRERIRQIEAKALRKLRDYKSRTLLKDFVN